MLFLHTTSGGLSLTAAFFWTDFSRFIALNAIWAHFLGTKLCFYPMLYLLNTLIKTKLTRNGKKKKLSFADESRRVGRSLIIANKRNRKFNFFQCKIEFYFIHEHQNLYFPSWLQPLVTILLLVSIRRNKIRSHTEKKKNNNNKKKKYPLSVITVFQYFKYINNKLKDRNIVVRGKVTISTAEQNDTCTSI